MTLAFLSCLLVTAADGPKVEPLWPSDVPGKVSPDAADQPSLTIFLPAKEKATGTAVVICPGGGYGGLAVGHEGRDVAQWLTDRGVAAFMLQYRVAKRGKLDPPIHPGPLQDAQRAIRTVRARAAELGIDPHRVGIWGFSAGGHLASSAGTHFDAGKTDAADPVERISCRPDFLILAYPVITFTQPSAHRGSRNNLLGPNPDPKLVEAFSNELQVTKDTPPTFLFHTEEDKGVPPENSRLFEAACKKAGVPVELVIFEKGAHGVGLAPKDPVLSKWPDRLEAWLKGRGLLEKK
jgi:acetyl esterase/lipase